jgi:hypothetical protein
MLSDSFLKKFFIQDKPLLRLIVMGYKILLDLSMRIRHYWGFVELVTTSTTDIRKTLS